MGGAAMLYYGLLGFLLLTQLQSTASMPHTNISSLTVPLRWAEPEGRLTISVSLFMSKTGQWQETVSRMDFGNLNGMMLPTDACSNCGKKCAPSKLLMPHDVCPSGAAPGTTQHSAKARKYVTCPSSD